MSAYVFSFAEGDGRNKMLLGGKGANLCEMTQIGLNVPPGFVISTEACLAYLDRGEMPAGLMNDVRDHLSRLEAATGKRLGDAGNPLLVSVRSGSAVSMPGMMDTVLNLGLNEHSVEGLISQTGNERFAWDSYRRFVQLFAKVALGVAEQPFDQAMARKKATSDAVEDVDLGAEALRELTHEFVEIVEKETGSPFPHEPLQQLEIAIQAVFRSWMGKRAVDYRRQFKITPQLANGTAVNVCSMVFGNMGSDSGTGVGFTRNPGTGENVVFGEYLVNAQGEDVVAGIRTPKPLADLATEMPAVYEELVVLRERLESHYHEVQDFEFTIERGRLHVLQTRNGKLNALALARTSVEMVAEGLIGREAALLRVDPDILEQLLVPRLAENHGGIPLAQGLPASPGAASGAIVFDADTAEALARDGKDIVLVREETRPEDIHGFFGARAILTARGGKTSHAAVVARGMGKPCVSGCEALRIDPVNRTMTVDERVLREGDVVTVDGSNGLVFAGRLPTVEPEFSAELEQLLQWADETATVRVRANADTPEDAARARAFGATGIGLCRTERMFNSADRLPIVQEMILSDSEATRAAALERLLPIQRADFAGILKAMHGLPVTIRLLDPPLHEFLPRADELSDQIMQRRAGGEVEGEPGTEELEFIRRRVLALAEVNPMLGHRGVRLGLTYPEIYRMQIRAVLEATADCLAEGIDVHPQIMVPQVTTAEELRRVREWADTIRGEVEARTGRTLPVRFGSMIETVRACLRAPRLAKETDFFSFGTNDLTQATFSFSREDAENKFLPLYNSVGLLRDNPFEVLDVEGVGRLIEIAIAWGRAVRPELEIGICGEHGGHPASIHFFHYAGLDYVSCSPPRVPAARLACAQARLLADGYVPYADLERSALPAGVG